MRRIGTNEIATGRIVGPMGSQADGRLYGIETQDSCEGLWGIRFSSSFYEKLVDNMSEGVYFVNRERPMTYWNEGAEWLSGYLSGEATGKAGSKNIVAHIDETARAASEDACPLPSVMLDRQSRTPELFPRQKQRHRAPLSLQVLPIRNTEGMIAGAVEVFSDSRVKLRFEKRVSQLEQVAFLDFLTGLPNRRHIELKVEQGLQDHQHMGRLYGLLMFDVDHFKAVNDTHGHEVGDMLLRAVGETMVRGLRPSDIVGRWGGEEFLVLAPDIDALALGDLAERCRLLIAQSSVITESSRVSVTASIGATVLTHSDSAESVIGRVDELMYQSKHAGGDRTTAG
jgi:diguanylate cyclase (GGDEF)-like protein